MNLIAKGSQPPVPKRREPAKTVFGEGALGGKRAGLEGEAGLDGETVRTVLETSPVQSTRDCSPTALH